jgi:hypothetical protein
MSLPAPSFTLCLSTLCDPKEVSRADAVPNYALHHEDVKRRKVKLNVPLKLTLDAVVSKCNLGETGRQGCIKSSILLTGSSGFVNTVITLLHF